MLGNLDDIVTQSSLIADHSGWLVEQSSGERRWCVIADMLLCVFETRKSERPLKVIMLPGHKVKAMVLLSAKQDTLANATSDFEERSLSSTMTITGVQRHQFAIYSPSTGQRYMFGADAKDTIDRWVAMATVATNLEVDIFTESEDDLDLDSNADSGYVPSVDKDLHESTHTKAAVESYSPSSHDASLPVAGMSSESAAVVTGQQEEEPAIPRYLPSPMMCTRGPTRSSTRSRGSDSGTEESNKPAFSKVRNVTLKAFLFYSPILIGTNLQSIPDSPNLTGTAFESNNQT